MLLWNCGMHHSPRHPQMPFYRATPGGEEENCGRLQEISVESNHLKKSTCHGRPGTLSAALTSDYTMCVRRPQDASYVLANPAALWGCICSPCLSKEQHLQQLPAFWESLDRFLVGCYELASLLRALIHHAQNVEHLLICRRLFHNTITSLCSRLP